MKAIFYMFSGHLYCCDKRNSPVANKFHRSLTPISKSDFLATYKTKKNSSVVALFYCDSPDKCLLCTYILRFVGLSYKRSIAVPFRQNPIYMSKIVKLESKVEKTNCKDTKSMYCVEITKNTVIGIKTSLLKMRISQVENRKLCVVNAKLNFGGNCTPYKSDFPVYTSDFSCNFTRFFYLKDVKWRIAYKINVLCVCLI